MHFDDFYLKDIYLLCQLRSLQEIDGIVRELNVKEIYFKGMTLAGAGEQSRTGAAPGSHNEGGQDHACVLEDEVGEQHYRSRGKEPPVRGCV